IARAIHRQSERRDNALVIVNCAALSPTVLESELFGHEKGAFTGASHRRLGRFELADKGTIFLDEIGEVPLELQSKLLRVLQDHQFERVGGEETIEVDLRVIAASNRDLPAAIKKGTFREDLYFRLKVVELIMPPLRERPEDVPLLAQHFIQRYAIDMGRPVPKLSASALTELQQYPWPGNIRELKNVLERAIVLTQDDNITAANLTITTGAAEELVEGDDLSLEASEERQVRRVLVMTEWHKSRAAVLLKVSRTRLDRMIRKYGIEKE
ncbi:MAG: sigma-54 dependent transcriptional regulator, partial [Planctomycetota bacterium]|nr:sigma-54 dependent transcriptional regulator [Planctomycetota bacterium]